VTPLLAGDLLRFERTAFRRVSHALEELFLAARHPLFVTTGWSSRSGESGPAWDLVSARYDFSQADPVPEPGTMVLVGMGGVAALLRRRKQRA
jgi:hypothetical protein